MAEKKNAALEVELMFLKHNQGLSASSNLFRVTSNGMLFSTRGAGAGGGSPESSFCDGMQNLAICLAQLEAKSDRNAIAIRVCTFRAPETARQSSFKYVPGGSFNTFCYDMGPLLNQVSRRITKTPPSDKVAHEAAVQKGGFPNKASQMIDGSYQTALPGVLNVTAMAEKAAFHPIPVIKTFNA